MLCNAGRCRGRGRFRWGVILIYATSCTCYRHAILLCFATYKFASDLRRTSPLLEQFARQDADG